MYQYQSLHPLQNYPQFIRNFTFEPLFYHNILNHDAFFFSQFYSRIVFSFIECCWISYTLLNKVLRVAISRDAVKFLVENKNCSELSWCFHSATPPRICLLFSSFFLNRTNPVLPANLRRCGSLIFFFVGPDHWPWWPQRSATLIALFFFFPLCLPLLQSFLFFSFSSSLILLPIFIPSFSSFRNASLYAKYDSAVDIHERFNGWRWGCGNLYLSLLQQAKQRAGERGLRSAHHLGHATPAARWPEDGEELESPRKAEAFWRYKLEILYDFSTRNKWQ